MGAGGQQQLSERRGNSPTPMGEREQRIKPLMEPGEGNESQVGYGHGRRVTEALVVD